MTLAQLRAELAEAMQTIAEVDPQFQQPFAEGYTLTAHKTNDDIQLAHSNQVIGMTSEVAIALRNALLTWFPL